MGDYNCTKCKGGAKVLQQHGLGDHELPSYNKAMTEMRPVCPTQENTFRAPHSASNQTDIRALVDCEPLVLLELSVNGTLLRLSPAWAVVAGALTTGVPLAGGIVLLIAGVLLADCAWGLLWHLLSQGQHGVADKRQGKVLRPLPYMQPYAPVVRVVRALRGAEFVYDDWRACAGALGLAVALSMIIGLWALFFTLVVLVFLLGIWVLGGPLRSRGLVGSIFVIGLPWLLGGGLFVSTATPFPKVQMYSLALALGFTLLHWGIQRYRFSQGRCVTSIVAGELLVISTLIIWSQPVVLAAVAGLWLPPNYWVMKLRRSASNEFALYKSAFWWWAVLATVATASLWGG